MQVSTCFVAHTLLRSKVRYRVHVFVHFVAHTLLCSMYYTEFVSINWMKYLESTSKDIFLLNLLVSEYGLLSSFG